jgi:deoxyribodipyrimidine photolyase
MKSKFRIELFFKTATELKDRIRFLSGRGITAYNVVNKNDKDTLMDWYSIIQKEQSNAHVCLHYSLKYNKVKRGSVEEHFNRLRTFLKESPANAEILLVSGSTCTTSWNSLVALEKLKSHSIDRRVAVAFNPYFPSETERQVEYDRLEKKLATGLVSKVYLQFGTDLELLQKALNKLKEYNIPVASSIFLPTKQLIAQQKFRPWKGVFLSETFLQGPDHARPIVVEIIRICNQYNVELAVEAPGIRRDGGLDLFFSMIKEAEAGRTWETEVSDSTPDVQETTRNDLGNDYLASVESMKATGETLSFDKSAVLLFGTHDLRLADNEAVSLACRHKYVVPVFLWNKSTPKWGVKGCSEVILKDALRNLSKELEQYQIPLVTVVTKDPTETLISIVKDASSRTVYWNSDYTPSSREEEKERRTQLAKMGVQFITCQSSLLFDVEKLNLSTGFHGGHWGTLMPFLKTCKKQLGEPRRSLSWAAIEKGLTQAAGLTVLPKGCTVDNLELAVMPPKTKWDKPILARFQMNRQVALARLDNFIQTGLPRYESERSRADKDMATSQLSVHLRFGILSPHEFYWRTEDCKLGYEDKKTFSRRIIWRDLAYFQMVCFPDMSDRSIRKHYDKTEWVQGEEAERRLDAWKRGQTGYPIVDAGMRELYATGWMAQSVRMVVASFLVEYLRLDWRHGLEWFHYTLADADQAINSMMWQNAGRSGIDQWNFVLSPETASQDVSGSYTRKWVPELSKLSLPYLHRPWQAFEGDLRVAGVVLGETYPHRIVSDLKEERQKSVASVLKMRHEAQEFNDDKGYDLIELPTGERTVVFTKKEYRIDRHGHVIAQTKQIGRGGANGKGSTSRKRRRTNKTVVL